MEIAWTCNVIRRSLVWQRHDSSVHRANVPYTTMRWNCSVCVWLHVLLSINLLFRRVVLCTALRVDVDALMGMAEIPSNSLTHAPRLSSTSRRRGVLPAEVCIEQHRPCQAPKTYYTSEVLLVVKHVWPVATTPNHESCLKSIKLPLLQHQLAPTALGQTDTQLGPCRCAAAD